MNQQMLGSIHQVLSKLGIGFNPSHRSIQLKFDQPALEQQVFIQRLDGRTAINEGLTANLICLSTDAHLGLKTFIGQAATIEQLTDQGQHHPLSGIITEAISGQSDGGFAVYQLKLQDSFSSLLAKRRNSRVFMQKSVIDITQILLAEWQQHSELFAKSMTFDKSQLSRTYDVRPFTMQSNESDYDFLTRLWRSEGINWFIDSAAPYQHQLNLFDDSKALSPLTTHTIRFHRSDATEQRDTITSLSATRQLSSSQMHIQRWDQQHGSMNEQTNLSVAKQSSSYSAARLSLEQAWHIGSAALGDLDGQDQNTLPHDDQLTRLGELLIKQQQLEGKSFTAFGSVRDVKVGYWFKLTGHSELDQQHNDTERQFLITQLDFFAQNNFPKELDARIAGLIQQSHQFALSSLWSLDQPHQVKMTLIRRDIPIVPFYDPLIHVAKAAPMRARVVGTQGEQIHVDAWGRIKVQFLFSRPQDNTHSGGAGSSGTDSDSAWLDVLTPWAGGDEASYGMRFLPRAGELVAIDFFDGNADRPFVLGRIHEGSRLPAQFDHQGTLPDTKALSGIKSQEINGQGFNQLRLDDTTGQISAQLQSSHGASQLNLGNLVHPRSNEEAESRGEGFELRTDMAGVIRSKAFYLSTFAQNKANANQLDISDALEQTSTSLTSMKALAEYTQKQQAEPADMLTTLEAYIQKVETQWSDLKAMKDAVMLIAAPKSIAVSSGDNLHLQALGGITTGSCKSINTSTDENWILNAKKKVSLFAGQDSFKLYAAKGKFDIQAQDNTVGITARQHVKIISTEDEVHINADKAIVLTAQGSQIRIDSNGITAITPKVFKAKAAQHLFEAGSKVNVPLPFFPQNICWECLVKRASQRSAFINKGDGT